ncbi:MAG: hypothetical protein M1365_00105, partial [Actinobacteria bacterium]|nr:hypothetical protein [Actinomycetota bacterium]
KKAKKLLEKNNAGGSNNSGNNGNNNDKNPKDKKDQTPKPFVKTIIPKENLKKWIKQANEFGKKYKVKF